ncbi:hypothetical protein HID58_094427, partial [Brassica napus]
LHTQISQTMNSKQPSTCFRRCYTTKPNGKDVVSSADPVKRVGQTGVSLARSASGVSKSKKPNSRAVISSTDPANRAGHPGDPLATAISGDSKSKKSRGKAVTSSTEPIKGARPHGVSPAIAVSGDPKSKILNGRSVVSSSAEVLFFKDVKYGPQEGELRFRLIHFWEARNALTKVLFGLEMLLIDGQGTVIQGFIPPNRIETYLPHLFAGSVYKLNNFYGSKSKTVYRVVEPDVTIAFSWNSVLSPLENSPVPFPEDRFRFYGYEEFEAACDLRGDVYGSLLSESIVYHLIDYVGHIKLVNEQTLSDSLVLDEVEIAFSRRILVHVQAHDGPVMKLYIWDKSAVDFCEKFKALGKPPTVILVTTVNPKRFGATREYLAWFESNTEVAKRVNAEIVTKAETATIGELLSYMKQEGAKVAWFECTATIDDVVRDSAWYYIACGGCKTKAIKGPTTPLCKKCGKTEIVGTPEYLTKISVYDNNDHASFVLLGDAGRELTEMKASDLVESYFEANENVGDDHVVPVPQSLTDSIGQSRTFIIKVSKHNLDGKTQSLTVTKVLPLEVPALEGDIDEGVEEETVDEKDGAADGNVKRISDGIESGETKHRKLTQLPYYIQIDQKTKTFNVTDIGPIFPVHNLSPQNYRNLLRLATTPTYLPDVIGQILIKQKTNPYHPELNIDATIGLRLNRLILCDKQAADFSILQSRKNRKFKVVIITSIVHKLFQGKLETLPLLPLHFLLFESHPPWLIKVVLPLIDLDDRGSVKSIIRSEKTITSVLEFRSYRSMIVYKEPDCCSQIPFRSSEDILAVIITRKLLSGIAIFVSEDL